MKLKKFLIGIVLPLALAAAVLTAGTLLPRWLLKRQEDSLLEQASTVAIDAVQPYGDSYDQMKTVLLACIRMLEGSEDTTILADTYDVYNYESWNTADEDVSAFLAAWSEQMSDAFYWQDFYGLMDVSQSLVYTNDSESAALNVIIGIDTIFTEDASLCYSEQGIPIQLSAVIDPYSMEPDTVWEGLLSAYQSQFGLEFTDTSVSYDTEGDDYDMENSGSDTDYLYYEAVSTDMSFLLAMDIGCQSDRWYVEFQMTENNL